MLWFLICLPFWMILIYVIPSVIMGSEYLPRWLNPRGTNVQLWYRDRIYYTKGFPVQIPGHPEILYMANLFYSSKIAPVLLSEDGKIYNLSAKETAYDSLYWIKG